MRLGKVPLTAAMTKRIWVVSVAQVKWVYIYYQKGWNSAILVLLRIG